MTKTALLKLSVAIVITFILILPEYFKTPKASFSRKNVLKRRNNTRWINKLSERTLELSCLEVCLQSNFTYSLSSLNFSFVTFLQPVRETQIIMRIFLNPSHFHNFTRTCQDITGEFKMCSLCLVCESKGNMDFISQEQTSKVLIRRGSMEVKANDFHSPCQQFNFTVAPLVDHLEEYNTNCHLKNHTGRSAIMEDEPSKGKPINHTCRIMEYPNDCIHVSLHLEMDVKNITCSMKITWYILVLLVFMFLIILTIRKILEGHRRVQKWQSDRDKPTSVLLRGSDSEKLRALNVQVISETKLRLPLDEVQEVLPPIPEL
ncbi:transmembrane protein 156 isoform X2 [Piliocolobus tephrosceles]|uniref:transmembrane protein 156 isoform X2 n=1 Tax=Piliocolobus tephrosceles TaxID=591936 RepID=UPI000C2A17E8|nr:transmembrane protein 156 isoform X2 [Piliocolobus tephrosceles]